LAAGVINIDRKKYAVGLFWQPLSAGQTPRNFAKQLSKKIQGGVKFYTDFRSMVGVGSLALGHRRGMKIAAVEAINYFSEYNSFLAEFFTPQGFWIVGVRNNIVIFDQLIQSEANAKQEFAKLITLPDWDVIVASGSWNVPRAVEKSLRDIIAGNSRPYLIPISSAFGNIISLIIFCAAVFGIWNLFQEPIIKMLAPRPQQIQINPEVLKEYKKQLEAKKAEIKETIQPVMVIHPYDNLSDQNLRADQCWRAIAFVMQPISGWVQQNAICEENTAKAMLKRNYGTLEGLYNSIDSLMGENVYVMENTESDVVISVDLTPLQPSGNNSPQTDIEDIIFSVNNIFQKIGEFANIKPSIETSGQGVTAVTTNMVIINTDSKLKPDEFIKMFNGISPMLLSSVKWDARSRTWNYEVKIYAK
jgi:hypothetical protein